VVAALLMFEVRQFFTEIIGIQTKGIQPNQVLVLVMEDRDYLAFCQINIISITIFN
jgi:hypothetical protein